MRCCENFEGPRHRNLLKIFEARADQMEDAFGPMLYSVQAIRGNWSAPIFSTVLLQASALFNQVSSPIRTDRRPRAAGAVSFYRCARSARHVSSLTFRSGLITADGNLSVDPTARLASSPRIERRTADGDEVEVIFKPDEDISERVIFPVTESQSNGIEDARFVEFNDDGRKIYYATYTAYSGRAIRSELIETSDFLSFRMSRLTGAATQNKGMALFPRKIGGKYAMIGRQDNENLYLIYSDDLHLWEGGEPILKPRFPWELVQIGNCGSPIELDEGWLMLTRCWPGLKYRSAVLLDKRSSKVIACRRTAATAAALGRKAETSSYLWRHAPGIDVRARLRLLQFCDDQDVALMRAMQSEKN